MKNKTKHYSLGKLGHLTAAAVIGLISGYAPETIAATPTIYLQSATINSAADAVTLNRVPVMNAAGTILYKDISMFFTVDTLGNVTLPPALVRITPSPTINVGAFKPGTYNVIIHIPYKNPATHLHCMIDFRHANILHKQ